MASRIEELQGRIVFPGEELAVIEEFIPGEGCYEEGGRIYAARAGRVVVDMATRRISVKPFQDKPRIPRKGMTVHGYVQGVPREDIALITIIADERLRPFNGTFTGILHVSQASIGRVESIYDVARLGEIVRATVLNNSNPFILSTRSASDGVILAFCSKCGAALYRVPGEEGLVCLRCGNREKRKISAHYMLVARPRKKR